MKYILILGGGTANKGAQAMVFQVVQEVNALGKDFEAVALCNPSNNDMTDDNYRFRLAPLTDKEITYFCGGIYRGYSKLKGVKKERIEMLQEIFENAVFCYDVSGYSFSSEWNYKNALKYLLRIKIMQRYNIPVVVMPQSFGPFDFQSTIKSIITKMARKLLAYPIRIYAREQFSLDAIKEMLTEDNAQLAPDMVFSGPEIDPSYIYKKIPEPLQADIGDNAAAIVPNMKVAQKGTMEAAIADYMRCIDTILELREGKVYLVAHSTADMTICKALIEYYFENTRVVLYDKELTCLEYEQLISKFEFAVVSRYHSLVHAYKSNVPCIVLGWSPKYSELMKLVSQEKYMLNNGDNFTADIIGNLVMSITKNAEREKELIRKGVENSRGTDFYRELKEL